MHSETDEFYGADIDGNRGVPMTFYELDESDTPEIESQINEFIESTGELPTNPFTVHLIDPLTENDIEFEVDPFEYAISDLAKSKLPSENFKKAIHKFKNREHIINQRMKEFKE